MDTRAFVHNIMMKTLFAILLLNALLPAQAFQAKHVGLAKLANVCRRECRVGLAKKLVNVGSRKGTPSPSFLQMATSSDNNEQERRSFIQNVAQSILFSSVLTSGSGNALADDSSNLPKVTHKVYMDIRISRPDGSFYVRDDVGAPSEEPFYGQLVLGLFGETTPNHVKQFLSYTEVPYDAGSNAPMPSYSRSKFQTLDTSTGLLIGGTIPGLDVTTLAGGNVLQYSGRVIPAKLWLEDKSISSDTSQLSHGVKGLLTHRNLDLTPSFGITTRNTSTNLDTTHTIFGCILEDKNGLVDKVVDLPVLTDTGRVSRTTNEPVTVGGGDIGGSLASSKLASTVFTAQRAVFRDAAKTFGDTRLGKVYDGKILRRIEVTKVGVL